MKYLRALTSRGGVINEYLYCAAIFARMNKPLEGFQTAV